MWEAVQGNLVVKSSGHSLACCFQRSSDDPHSAETPSRKRKKSSPEHQPAKCTRLTDNSTSVTTYRNRNGGTGVILNGQSYKKKKIRKKDNVHIWICNQPKWNATIETTGNYNLINCLGLHCHDTQLPNNVTSPCLDEYLESAKNNPLSATSTSARETISTFLTKKGKTGITSDGYTYIRKIVIGKHNNVHVWICSKANCRAAIETSSDLEFIASRGSHDHDVPPLPPSTSLTPHALCNGPAPHALCNGPASHALCVLRHNKVWREGYCCK